MNRLTLEEWKEQGKKLFGTEDFREWKFVCAYCGNVQSYKDFDGLVDEPQDYMFFSCLGRVKDGVGCDWTLGGLLQIHKTEVIDEEGISHPTFEFAQ